MKLSEPVAIVIGKLYSSIAFKSEIQKFLVILLKGALY